MAIQAYVSIHGKVQGPFRGNDKHGWGAKSSEVHAFSYGVEAPYDTATGHASGKRQHTPITITKEWGASSPQLWQSCVSNEVLDSVVIKFADPETNQPKRNPYEIRLTNAAVSQIHHVGGGKDRVSFVYEEIQTLGGTPPPGVHLTHIHRK